MNKAFPGDETGVLHEPEPVQYDKNPGITFDSKSHETLFFSKLADWSYEQEVRVVMALSDCKKDKKHGLYLFSIPAEHISRFILGWQMEPKAANKIRKPVKTHNPSVEIVSARTENGRIICP